MSLRRRAVAVAAVIAAAALFLPGSAVAHAYLTRTAPAASRVLNGPPTSVALTFDEAVEPRFAVISVTDASGSEKAAAVSRSHANPDTILVPLAAHLPEGWYLVYWRAVSVDGHPVQGAFTFAVGPSPGPAPQFPVPHVSATAVTAPLLVARWVMFTALMSAIGLFVLRLLIARPAVRRLPGANLRAVSLAFALSAGIGLIAIPVYLDLSIANDSLRSAFDLGALVPLYRATAFGRGLLDLELCFALFVAAAAVALWLDRPDRGPRSLAELGATAGALLAAIAALTVPGAIGHAGQTSPRGLSLLLDLVHLASGAIWLGGLIGLLVLWLSLRRLARPGGPSRVEVLTVVVPRFSKVALVSVLVLLATGTASTVVHMPALNALWQTGYGVAILVKVALLLAAMALGAVNLVRTTPGLLAAADAGLAPPTGSGAESAAATVLRRPAPSPELVPAPGAVASTLVARLPEPPSPPLVAHRREAASTLLSRTISGELVLVTGAVFAAAVLSSLAPPPPSFALQNSALVKVGPGRVLASAHEAGYELQVVVAPNKAAAPNQFALRLLRGGRPVRGATVTLAFNHLEMQMPQQQYGLREIAPGLYSRSAPALVMVGRWALAFQVTPPGGTTFTALIVDQAEG